MSNTTANEVIQSFESSFVDKKVLPDSLEIEWLKKAIGRFSIELDTLNFDEELNEFDCQLDRYVIDTLVAFWPFEIVLFSCYVQFLYIASIRYHS